jgi:hypothetical protein
MSSLALFKAFAYIVIIVWSRWISLAERNHSNFALIFSCVPVRIYILFLAMPMKGVNGRSKPMRVGHHTRIRRLRALMEVILF